MSTTWDLGSLDAIGQAELVRAGDVAPSELVEAAIARIEKLDPLLNAVITPRFEKALEEARSPDLPDGPFRGVPILLKDLGAAQKGEPAHSGNALLRRLDVRAAEDSALARSLRAAGFVVLGRTNVPEFGLVTTTEPAAYGATLNPWDRTRSTGGSSGGAAAGVASGMVPLAQGSDGGGSIRNLSSHCGLFGLKPSRGRISSAPAGDGMEAHVVYGFLSRSVRDNALALDVAAGYRAGDAVTPAAPDTGFAALVDRDPPALRIGTMTVPDVNGYPVDPEVNAVVEQAGALLESLGHNVEQAYPAAMVDPEYLQRWVDLLSPSVTALFGELETLAGGDLQRADAEEMTWWWRDRGARLSTRQHVENQAWRDGFRRQMCSWWAGGHDILLCPVLPTPATPLGFFDGEEGLRRSVEILCFTPQFNTTGQPAASLPIGMSTAGLPIGVQIGAGPGREDLLVRLAGQIERAAPWIDRRPPIHA